MKEALNTMATTSAKKLASNARYNEKCGRIELRPLQEEADIIKQSAKECGESTQGYILEACRRRRESNGYYTLKIPKAKIDDLAALQGIEPKELLKQLFKKVMEHCEI